MKFKVKLKLRHNHKEYEPGDIIELKEEQAQIIPYALEKVKENKTNTKGNKDKK